MTTHPYLQTGLSILHAKLQQPVQPTPYSAPTAVVPFLTISREACAGATTLGRHLLPLLEAELGDDDRSWMFLDKDLIQQALNATQLPAHLADYLPEDRLPEIKGLIGELVGLHPPLWELEHRVEEAIRRFAELGRVIIAGRAAHLLTQDLPGGFHLRLVAPLAARIHRAQQVHNLDASAAESFLRASDTARARHVQTHHDRDINDPHAYDLVINTGRVPPDSAARLVLHAMMERMAQLQPAGIT